MRAGTPSVADPVHEKRMRLEDNRVRCDQTPAFLPHASKELGSSRVAGVLGDQAGEEAYAVDEDASHLLSE